MTDVTAVAGFVFIPLIYFALARVGAELILVFIMSNIIPYPIIFFILKYRRKKFKLLRLRAMKGNLNNDLGRAGAINQQNRTRWHKAIGRSLDSTLDRIEMPIRITLSIVLFLWLYLGWQMFLTSLGLIALLFFITLSVTLTLKLSILTIQKSKLLTRLDRSGSMSIYYAFGRQAFGRVDWNEWIQSYAILIFLTFSGCLGLLKGAAVSVESTYQMYFPSESHRFKNGEYTIFLSSERGMYLVGEAEDGFLFVPHDAGYIAQRLPGGGGYDANDALTVWLQENSVCKWMRGNICQN
ncbi:hypothetical protein [Thalassorhabdomicrobium marinisediminis]|uniref:hypothetical protein n=1 Tax=Thalassorhabdomicrobium marinisediminis TaxID=2170577 RepID=UPI0011B262CE|nr:hypothetical protein [Thalassorhabdomicrobium marinisediminis]